MRSIWIYIAVSHICMHVLCCLLFCDASVGDCSALLPCATPLFWLLLPFCRPIALSPRSFCKFKRHNTIAGSNVCIKEIVDRFCVFRLYRIRRAMITNKPTTEYSVELWATITQLRWRIVRSKPLPSHIMPCRSFSCIIFPSKAVFTCSHF